MLITVLLAESAQIGNTNAILPMTTVASAGAYLPSTPMALTHVNGGGQKVLFPKEHNKVG
jgi:hypothetical protein